MGEGWEEFVEEEEEQHTTVAVERWRQRGGHMQGTHCPTVQGQRERVCFHWVTCHETGLICRLSCCCSKHHPCRVIRKMLFQGDSTNCLIWSWHKRKRGAASGPRGSALMGFFPPCFISVAFVVVHQAALGRRISGQNAGLRRKEKRRTRFTPTSLGAQTWSKVDGRRLPDAKCYPLSALRIV